MQGLMKLMCEICECTPKEIKQAYKVFQQDLKAEQQEQQQIKTA